MHAGYRLSSGSPIRSVASRSFCFDTADAHIGWTAVKTRPFRVHPQIRLIVHPTTCRTGSERCRLSGIALVIAVSTGASCGFLERAHVDERAVEARSVPVPSAAPPRERAPNRPESDSATLRPASTDVDPVVAALQTIDPIDLCLTALDDSSGYLVYRYTASNPTTSTQGVAAIRLDVSASPGPSLPSLPATGRFLDGPAVESALPVAPHAQLGPVSPPGWQAALDRSTPFLDWFGVNGRMFDYDSIAPGDSLPGLGIRSTFYPAIREVGAVPTWQSCCQEPWGTEEQNPMRAHRDPAYFMVTSYALAPGYRPGEVTIDLVQTQLSTICSDPLWLDDRAVCYELGALADRASFRLTASDIIHAAAALGELRDKVDSERARMEPEAYWLLYYNVRQAYANIRELVPTDMRPQSLEAPDFRLLAIDDSARYLAYSYSLKNPPSSTWSVAGLSLDVRATSGTPSALPATGEFWDLTADSTVAHPPQPLEPYVQIGPITPSEWLAILRGNGWLSWVAPENGLFATDSVSPGDTLSGFGLRSTYLPAIRRVRAEPTWQSCCRWPDPGALENPRTREFAVSSYAIAPGYRPEEITVGVLRSQLDTVCTDPLWLNDGNLCMELGDLMDQAASDLASRNVSAAAATLADLRDRVDRVRARMEPEAYWLLYYNVRQVQVNILRPERAWAPERARNAT